MKKILVLMLVLAFVLSATAVAVAGQGGGGYQAGGGTSYAGSNHGNYSATTNACKKCHAVHNAGGGSGTGAGGAGSSYKLLRYRYTQDAPGACLYCHDGTNGTLPAQYKVYTKTVEDSSPTTAKHTVAETTVTIPDSTLGVGPLGRGRVGSLDCLDCHTGAPHGAGMDGVDDDVLTFFPDPAGADSGSYCSNCHDKNNDTVVNGDSHRINAVATDNSGTGGIKIANVDAANCRSCHTSVKLPYISGVQAKEGDFPHSADDGGRFLGGNINASAAIADGAAGDSRITAKCFECHRWNDGTDQGVGISY